jgi:hypothetical protein
MKIGRAFLIPRMGGPGVPGGGAVESAGVDWSQWHDAYDDPASGLARRLVVVQRLIGDELDRQPAPLTAVSLCAGAGDDLIGALIPRPAHHGMRALMVELDTGMAGRAREAARAAGLEGLVVRRADAARSDTYAGWAPAGLVLLCGVLGNVTDQDGERTVRAMAQLARRGSVVIWTRHRREPDLTPRIRAWFADEGFAEEAFISPGPGEFSVGMHRLERAPDPLAPAEVWFTFTR